MKPGPFSWTQFESSMASCCITSLTRSQAPTSPGGRGKTADQATMTLFSRLVVQEVEPDRNRFAVSQNASASRAEQAGFDEMPGPGNPKGLFAGARTQLLIKILQVPLDGSGGNAKGFRGAFHGQPHPSQMENFQLPNCWIQAWKTSNAYRRPPLRTHLNSSITLLFLRASFLHRYKGPTASASAEAPRLRCKVSSVS